jgi:hypothetical protein
VLLISPIKMDILKTRFVPRCKHMAFRF